MNTVKNVIAASTLVLANLFSPVANAEITGGQIAPLVDGFLAQAASSPSEVFNSCVKNNFISGNPKKDTELWHAVHQAMIGAVASHQVENEAGFKILVDDLVNQVCGDSQMAGGGDQTPAPTTETPTTDKGVGSPSASL